jgi:hypothetical protein
VLGRYVGLGLCGITVGPWNIAITLLIASTKLKQPKVLNGFRPARPSTLSTNFCFSTIQNLLARRILQVYCGTKIYSPTDSTTVTASGPVSTTVGDHVGIPGVVLFLEAKLTVDGTRLRIFCKHVSFFQCGLYGRQCCGCCCGGGGLYVYYL